tara:strand:+ start:971 stop:1813 length:843 start_codon:yes stop_codon:yes gene_type:complete
MMAEKIQLPRCFFNKQNKYSFYEPREDIVEWSDEQIKQLMIDKNVYNESLGGQLVKISEGMSVLISPHFLHRAWNRLGTIEKTTEYASKLISNEKLSLHNRDLLEKVMNHRLKIGIREFIIKIIENGKHYYDLCRAYDEIYEDEKNYNVDRGITNIQTQIEELFKGHTQLQEHLLKKYEGHLETTDNEANKQTIKKWHKKMLAKNKATLTKNIWKVINQKKSAHKNTYCFVVGDIPILMKVEESQQGILVLKNTYAPKDSIAKNKWISCTKFNRWGEIKS